MLARNARSHKNQSAVPERRTACGLDGELLFTRRAAVRVPVALRILNRDNSAVRITQNSVFDAKSVIANLIRPNCISAVIHTAWVIRPLNTSFRNYILILHSTACVGSRRCLNSESASDNKSQS